MSFAASTLRYPQTFFTPKTLDLLVVHCPAFGAGVVISGPEPAPRMILRVLAKPGPQRRIRVLRRGRDRLVSLSGAVLPGNAAGEPLADPQHALQVTNG